MKKRQKKEGIKLSMELSMLNKEYCQKLAYQYIEENDWKHIPPKALAKEIYGHAFVFYRMKFLSKVAVLDQKIYSHASDGVDIEDKIDKHQTLWEFLWLF